jgi:hypothetical protein
MKDFFKVVLCVQSYVSFRELAAGRLRESGFEYLQGSSTSRRKRRKGDTVPGAITGSPRLGEYQIWDIKIWSWVSEDSDQRMTALARTSSSCKWQTHPLVREEAPHQQTRNCLTVIKICSWAPDGCLTPRQTGRLTVGRNIILTLGWCKMVASLQGHESRKQRNVSRWKPLPSNVTEKSSVCVTVICEV